MAPIGWPPKVPPGYRAALRDVRSRNAQFRRNAAISLGRADPEKREEALGAASALLDDEDRAVRLEAIAAVTRLEGRSLASRIEQFLDSPVTDERMAALDFFARYGEASRFDRIRPMIEGDGEIEVRCMALETLSYLDASACLDLVRRMLQQSGELHPGIMSTLIFVLSEIGDLEDFELLPPFLDHPSVGVRVEAAHALAMMRRTSGRELAAAILLDAAELIRDRRLRDLALEGLCALRSEETVSAARRRFGKLLISRFEKVHWAGMCARAGDAKAGAYLRKVYSGKTVPLAARVLTVAGLCGLEEWTDVMEENLQNYLRGRSDDFLYDSIYALGRMGGSGALAVMRRLEKQLRPEHPGVADVLEGEIEVAETLEEEGRGTEERS
jgi:HEAT repeat protein